MKGIEELFEETFNNRWPEFSYRKRTVALSPATLKKEFKAFRFGPSPPPTNPPSTKTSSQSALSGSGRKASSQKIAAGSPRVPNAEGDLDPPQPQPEVVVIEDPGIAPEKKKVDTESDKDDEEVVDEAQLEGALSQPKPVEKSQAEQPKPQSQQEQPNFQPQKDPKSQHDSPKSQN